MSKNNDPTEFEKRLIKGIKCLYRYSGIETISNKARITEEQQPKKILPSLPIWLIGIYAATYGVASQRYENRVDLIENKVNTIYPQLTSPDPTTKGMAFSRIPFIQQMGCPYKPNILNPITVYLSFLKNSKYEGVAELMKDTIENWKGTLKGVYFSKLNIREANLWEANLEEASLRYADLTEADLEGANLKEADLTKANLMEANLVEADLRGANLRGAVLSEADLWGAVLSEADLEGANLKGADLRGANLQDANLQLAVLKDVKLWDANLQNANLQHAVLKDANLQGANLQGANLENAKNLTIEQLSKVYTLYMAKLKLELMAQVKEKYHHLLEEPKR